MRAPSPRIGARVKIVGTSHSPARTRGATARLLGRHGTVVESLRNAALALVKLDSEPHGVTGRTRCWQIHWEDLLVCRAQQMTDGDTESYRLGLSGLDREAVQHAVAVGEAAGLCGQPVLPLPVLGWSLRFMPTSRRACPACVCLSERPVDDR
ncbi:hypothetical protein GCM10010149_44330 [Nonomuraea roseoviolacea subsp. roseoviolacea]